MSESTDYRSVTVPEDKHPTEYSYVERRAEILSLIEEAGHPDALNLTRLAERYDTSPSNIHKDKRRLREYYREHIGDHATSITEVVYRSAIKAYVDQGDYDKAIDALESWNDWLREEGARSVDPRRIEHGGAIGVGAAELTDSERADLDAITSTGPAETGVDG